MYSIIGRGEFWKAFSAMHCRQIVSQPLILQIHSLNGRLGFCQRYHDYGREAHKVPRNIKKYKSNYRISCVLQELRDMKKISSESNHTFSALANESPTSAHQLKWYCLMSTSLQVYRVGAPLRARMYVSLPSLNTAISKALANALSAAAAG